MNKKGIIYLLFFVYHFGFSQNLVLNPSFEKNHTQSQCVVDNKCLCDSWLIPNYSTPDYINKKENVYGITRNELLTKQLPFDGNACAGLVLFGWCGGYLEQITGTLSKPLMKDSLYEICFQLKFVGELSLYRIKLVGIKFANNEKLYPSYIDGFNPFYKDMYKEKEKYIADIEFDVLNTFDSAMWIEHKAVYKAKGSEEFFTFGFFYQSNNLFELKIEKMVSTWPKGAKQEHHFYKRHGSNSFIEISPNIKNERVRIQQKSHASSYYLIDNVSIKTID